MARSFVKFTPHKVSKIRWRPASEERFLGSDVFLTGSWGSKANELKLWQFQQEDLAGKGFRPVGLDTVTQQADFMDIKFIDGDRFLTASSDGSVQLYAIKSAGLPLNASWKFKSLRTWTGVHKKYKQLPCTAVTNFEEEIATVGEDGRIVFLNPTRQEPLRSIDKGESGWLTCVCYLKHNELVVANLRGQLKVYDLLTACDKPSAIFTYAEDKMVGITCLAQHPTQPHIVATGSEEGTLGIWDVRKEKYPVTLLKGHTSEVRELKFHPLNPDHLFTCSFGGETWQWNGAPKSRAGGTSQPLEAPVETLWLSGSLAQGRVETRAALPDSHLAINTLDICQSSLICGGDNAAIFLSHDLEVY